MCPCTWLPASGCNGCSTTGWSREDADVDFTATAYKDIDAVMEAQKGKLKGRGQRTHLSMDEMNAVIADAACWKLPRGSR